MIKFIKFLINEKLLVKLIIVLILGTGIFALTNINREAIPEVNFDMLTAVTIYPGGSPDELEKLITIPIEKKLREINGLDKVRSYNIENVSVIAIYIEDEAPDKKQIVDDIKDAIDSVEDLPDKAEETVVTELKTDKTQAISIALIGRDDKVEFKKIYETANELEDFLYDIDGVAEVTDRGFIEREFLVEVEPSALSKYRIDLGKVIDTIKFRNLDLPGGSLKIRDKEYILRTKGQYKTGKEIADTVIIANDLDYITKIKDVAKVNNTFEELTKIEHFNGKRAIIFTVWKKKIADQINLVNKIREQVNNYNYINKDKIQLVYYDDWSIETKDRISSVLTNAIIGFFLLSAILLLLLGFRMSSLVILGIPISFLIAFIGMKILGITINIISLFGMIMVLGMIVDFSIVVIENTHRYIKMGYDKIEAIENGIAEIVWPVTVTLLCISATFVPLLLLPGIMGKFIKGIPTVIILSLTASWVIAIFFMPPLLNMFLKNKKSVGKQNNIEESEENLYEEGLFSIVQKIYKKLLSTSLKHRYITVLILLLLLFGSFGLIKVIGFVFMPAGGEKRLEIISSLPIGTNLKTNIKEIKKIEKIILKLPKEELINVHSAIGEDVPFLLDPKPGDATNKTTTTIYLTDEKLRMRKADLILKEIKKNILKAQKSGIINKKISFKFEAKMKGPPIGKPINIEIRGKEYKTINKIAAEYIAYLKKIEGVYDIFIDFEMGKQEYRYTINDKMAALTGVSATSIAVALNASFKGITASTLKEDEDEIDIRVRFPEKALNSLKSLNNVMIANRKGGLIPLSRVTRLNKQSGIAKINRLNFKRMVQVQANVDLSKTTSMKINEKLAEKFKDIEKKYPNYFVKYGGENEETNESMGDLGVLFIFAVAFIFIILAAYFNSLMLPVVVMSAIPFAIIGIALALFLHGEPMSFMSVLGFFALSGIIVSNTLVLVQFINNVRDKGFELKESLIRAGIIRLKPVLLTSGTTVLGLFPTIYAFGGKDYFVYPLALSFGYGLIFATFITMILIPNFYCIAEDIKGLYAKLLGIVGIEINPDIYDSKKIDT